MPRVLLRADNSATGEAPVLDGFRDVRRANLGAVSEIGDGAGDFEDAMPGAGREVELSGCLFEQLSADGIGRAARVDFGGAQAGIHLALARKLAGAGGFDAIAHAGRTFTVGLADQGVGRQGWHLDEQVDTIEKRAGELAAIAGDLVRRAAAFSVRVAVMAARTGIHRGNQLEFGREFRLAGGPGDVNAAGFERLAQGFEHFAIEFRQFVQKEDSLVSQADFAGAGRIAAGGKSAK